MKLDGTARSWECETEETLSFRPPSDGDGWIDEIDIVSRAKVTTQHYIHSFPNEPYDLVAPIPVSIETSGGEVMASWREANVAIAADRMSIALGDLAAEILDTYDVYTSERDNLAPGPAHQLQVMSRHIAKREHH